MAERGESLLIALSRSRHPRPNREPQLLVSVPVPHRLSRRSPSSILVSAGTDGTNWVTSDQAEHRRAEPSSLLDARPCRRQREEPGSESPLPTIRDGTSSVKRSTLPAERCAQRENEAAQSERGSSRRARRRPTIGALCGAPRGRARGAPVRGSGTRRCSKAVADYRCRGGALAANARASSVVSRVDARRSTRRSVRKCLEYGPASAFAVTGRVMARVCARSLARALAGHDGGATATLAYPTVGNATAGRWTFGGLGARGARAALRGRIGRLARV